MKTTPNLNRFVRYLFALLVGSILFFSSVHTVLACPLTNGGGSDPYWVEDLDDLVTISDSSSDCWDENFILKADINASATRDGDASNDGDGFSPIGNMTKKFTGTFDGNGHIISNLYIGRSSENGIGLFGVTDTSSDIKNLNLTEASMNGNESVGGLVGLIMGGTVSNCSSSGSINGFQDVGGISGTTSGGTISNSYSTASVSGSGTRVGGLVGTHENATIVACYSTGDVSGDNFVGGFAGYLELGAIITNSFSIGKVTGDTSNDIGGFIGDLDNTNVIANANSFWNTATSGQDHGVGSDTNDDTSADVMGKTTSEMQTEATFSGWDFGDVWHIYDGEYPFLQWQERTDISISSTGDDSVTAGSEVTLEFTINNITNGLMAYDVVLTDDLPDEIENAQYRSSEDNGSTWSSWSSWTGSATVGDLDTESDMAIKVQIKGTVSAGLSGSLPNTASVDFSGTDTDPSNNSVTHTLSDEAGSPTIPTLVYPTDGAIGISVLPSIKWYEVTDPDGDDVTYYITICQSSDLSGSDCNPIEVDTSSQAISSLSGFGPKAAAGLAVFFLLTGLWLIKRKHFRKIAASLLAAGFIFAGCAGGGGGGSGDSGETEITYTPSTALSSATTYYWRIKAEDENGNSAESDIWSFTTE